MRTSTGPAVLTAATMIVVGLSSSSSIQSSDAFSVFQTPTTSTRMTTTTSSIKSPTIRAISTLFRSSASSSNKSDSDGNTSAAAAATTQKPRRKPLSPDEILKQQREKQGLGGDEEIKIFDDDMLDKMQQILLILEKRAKEGPGSLSASEVDGFVSLTQTVVDEMNAHENNNRLKDATPPPASPAVPDPVVATASVTAAVQTAPQAPPAQAPSKTTQTDLSEDAEEYGPAYDGTGGMGMARGTRNTYVIEGMDEMSPEEYQKALQDSIKQRQQERTTSSRLYGNRATWDYLSSLNAGGGALKEGEEGDDNNEEEEDRERP